MIDHPKTNVVEMDMVIGTVARHKVLITLLFCSCNFMHAFLLSDNKLHEVMELIQINPGDVYLKPDILR